MDAAHEGVFCADSRKTGAGFAPDCSATELGRTVGASERTLSRLFHTELQMSFQQWRTQPRIQHALMLLADGNTVTGTAIRLGWANPSAFIDAFARTTGQYLSELRTATWIKTRPRER